MNYTQEAYGAARYMKEAGMQVTEIASLLGVHTRCSSSAPHHQHGLQLRVRNGPALPLHWYLFIAANSLSYLAVGLFIFRLLEKKAMRMNMMGQY